MKLRLKLIILFFANLFIVLNIIYLAFAIINSISFDIISKFNPDHDFLNTLNILVLKYHALIIFILVILVYAWLLINPLLHILEWIQLLATEQYREPVRKDGTARSVSKRTGKFKYSFIFYKSIIDYLHQLTTILKKSKQERNELEKMKREWVADIAHDLKTPLSYIKGYSSLLLSDKNWSSEEQVTFLKKIEEKSEYMETLLKNLNDTFKFDQQSIEISMQQQDIVGFMREILIDFSNDPITEGYEIRFLNDPEHSIICYFHQQFLQRVIVNLISNAILHNPLGTVIEIIIQQVDTMIEIIVKDNGKGMNAETVANIFNRYYKSEDSDEKRSSGLGMTIAKQLVEAHHGDICIQSALGKGTMITIQLPLKC